MNWRWHRHKLTDAISRGHFMCAYLREHMDKRNQINIDIKQ